MHPNDGASLASRTKCQTFLYAHLSHLVALFPTQRVGPLAGDWRAGRTLRPCSPPRVKQMSGPKPKGQKARSAIATRTKPARPPALMAGLHGVALSTCTKTKPMASQRLHEGLAAAIQAILLQRLQWIAHPCSDCVQSQSEAASAVCRSRSVQRQGLPIGNQMASHIDMKMAAPLVSKRVGAGCTGPIHIGSSGKQYVPQNLKFNDSI